MDANNVTQMGNASRRVPRRFGETHNAELERPKITDDVGPTREDLYTPSLSLFFLLCTSWTFRIAAMFPSSLRSVCRNGPVVARSFSSTAATSAAEVKSLGVIGAGQMVCPLHALAGAFLRLYRASELLLSQPRRLKCQ